MIRLGAICASLLGALLVSCINESAHGNDPNSSRTRVYIADIITMDPTNPTAEAVAVRDGKIIAVASVEKIRADHSSENLVLDDTFAGKTVLPGFIDNHLHPSMAAVLLQTEFITPFDWDLPHGQVKGVLGKTAYLDRLAELAASAPESEWLLSWGMHPYFHGEIRRADLDAMSTTRPIAIWHRSFHEVFVNSAALELMDLDLEEVATHPHVDLDNGHFFETGLPIGEAALMPQLLASAGFQSGLAQVREIVHRGGITTIADMGAGTFDFSEEWPHIQAVFDNDRTPFRTLFVPAATGFGQGVDQSKSIAEIRALASQNSNRLRFLDQVKLFADGAFYSQLMQLGEPGYLDDHEGEWITEPEQLEKLARKYWEAGLQIHVHVNGDLGVETVLDIVEHLMAEIPNPDHRLTLHHVGYTTVEQTQRMAELGVLVSANPYYLCTLGEKYSEIGLGPKRAHVIFRGRSFIDAGVPLSLHSDFPMAPASPLLLAGVSINRRAAFSGAVLAPELKISVDDALRAITIEAAFALGLEDEIGSIEIGKRADFTILEQDPYAVSPQAFDQIAIWGTVYEGKAFPLHE